MGERVDYGVKKCRGRASDARAMRSECANETAVASCESAC